MEMKRENDRLGGLIRAALRDEAACCRLPDDFVARLVRYTVGEAKAGNMPRWMKTAALLAVTASFAAFAAWVGVTVCESEEPATPEAPAADPETEMISKEGDNTMMARKVATLVGAAMVSVAVPATELTSEPTFVFLRPETSSFWNTATNSTMTLPIDFPQGATSASLTVRGDRYDRTYDGLVTNSFVLELPQPTSPETENVYDLTLAFDDGTMRTAKLGLIQGLSPDAEGTTRCLAPIHGSVWNNVEKRAVLPIPYGTTSFTVNGVETDTGLAGAQGWYALRGRNGETYSLSLVANGVNYLASLVGYGSGILLILK